MKNAPNVKMRGVGWRTSGGIGRAVPTRQATGSGLGRGFDEYLKELVFEMQLLLFEVFNFLGRAWDDVLLHVLDGLVERVVLIEQMLEMAVVLLELTDQVAVFGEHGMTPFTDDGTGGQLRPLQPS
jgi:hypothetical protein